MKLELELLDVPKVVNFLDGLSMKGLKGINRTKLTMHLANVLQEESENEKALREEFKDDKERLQDEMEEFYKQKIIVDESKFLIPLKTVKAKIKEITSDDSDFEFSGNDSIAATILYEAFDLDDETKE